MLLQSVLKEILLNQRAYFTHSEHYIEREQASDIRLDIPMAVILTGIRRAGKSTLLKHLLLKTNPEKVVGYIHFDDPRLTAFEVEDFYKVEAIWPELRRFQFDEIQRVHGWENYIRQGLERGLHFALTGSNAVLLSKELGTLLTGRHLSYEVFPFSFQEYCHFLHRNIDADSFDTYLETGGFPEYIAHTIPKYHQELFKDIVQRDIAVRNGIRNTQDLILLALHLLNNVARPFTYTRLARIYGIKSVKTVIDFMAHFEDAYLLFTLNKFDFSFKKQQSNEKKIYAIDHVFARQNSTQLHQDQGRMLENIVFIALRRHTQSVWFYKSRHECDFVYRLNESLHVIQVCWELNLENMDREVKGLQEAYREVSAKTALILTAYQEDLLHVDGMEIRCLPFWKWDLG